MPASIIPFLNDSSFSPEQTLAMGQAYDMAVRALHDRGQPSLVMELIAKSVIEVARTGERDPARLSQAALERLGFSAP